MKPQPATRKRLEIIAAATARGQSDIQIARQLGVSRSTVERLRARYGIPSGWQHPPRTHGIYSTYTSGCRCQPCTQAHTEWARAGRHRRYQQSRAGTAPDHSHGVSGYINWGCRCDTCSDAHRGQMAKYRAERNQP